MIGATPPSSMCRGANRLPGKAPRRLCGFAPHTRESLILPLRGANRLPGKAPRRLCEFAPHSRESLILPLRGANPSPGKAAGASVSLSPIPGKALFFRRGAQTLHPEKPRRLREFAPPSRESLILPLRGANPLAGKAPAAGVSLRLPPGKALFLRRGAQTLHPEEPPAAVRVCAPFS